MPKKGEAPSLEDRTNQARKMQSRQEARDQNGRRHKRRRKASTRFYSILVVLFAVAIGVTLCMTVFFNIQTIQVQGETRYETEEIIRASGLAKGKNLLLADIKGGEEDLTVKLPYIGSAHIVRQLPATVIIEVEENTPAYAVQMEGGWAVADENGKTLEYLQGQVPSVPVVVGISVTGAPPGYPMEFEDEEQKNKLTDLTKALKENNLIEKTTQMDFTNSSDITVLYDNRITLKCGGAVDLDAKLAMAQEAIARKAPDEQKATIVLTSTQATVRFGDASSGSSSQSSSSPPEEDASAGDEGGSSPESESKRTGENSALSSVD
ncbi:cell division protein FtsQ/DivIB [Solibaculum mannosilyticum]|uniref:cell division protein FtsQ/DivIB n=1 Tax=Solibaculum mannosilyticum TaxID=2780922 RepID=UPI0036F426E3